MPQHPSDPVRTRWRASHKLQCLARELRQDMTPAEAMLWQRIRNEQLVGAHFRKQHAIGQYIVDFICIKAKLIVEVDGDTHAEPAQMTHDAERTQWLRAQKQYRVLRFANEDIYKSPTTVISIITDALHESR